MDKGYITLGTALKKLRAERGLRQNVYIRQGGRGACGAEFRDSLRGSGVMERKKRINIPCKLTPVQRTAICLDGEQLCVMLCGSLPTLMAHLLVRDHVRLYAVRTSAELKETLMDADGIPADLVIVEAHAMADLPRMSFFSPADNHESEVIFSPDPFITDEKRFEEIYALIDKMLKEKQQRIEKIWELFEKENGDCAGSHEI